VVNKVMMLGPNMWGRGGVSSVLKGYYDSGILSRLGIDYYLTYKSGPNLYKLFLFVWMLPGIILNIPKYNILHIHSASWWSFRRKMVLIFLAKVFRRKVIVHIHGGKFDFYYHHAFLIEKKLIRYALSIVDRVVVLSQEWQQKIETFCDQDKIVVIPNCVHRVELTAEIYAEKVRSPKNIIFLGDIISRKGVYDLVEAIRILNYAACDVQVFLYGSGELEEVRSRVDSLGLAEIIKIPGWINPEQKEEVLRKAYLFVLPSYFEGLPVSILEALAHAVPVISTPIGGIPNAVIDGFNGYLVATNSPKKLAERIEYLLENEPVWKKFSTNAYNIAKSRFSMEFLEEQLCRMYAEVSP